MITIYRISQYGRWSMNRPAGAHVYFATIRSAVERVEFEVRREYEREQRAQPREDWFWSGNKYDRLALKSAVYSTFVLEAVLVSP